VALGFFLFAVMVQMLPRFAGELASHTAAMYLLVNVSWTVLAAILAGYISALLAGRLEFPHAAAVGLLVVGMAFVSMRQEGASRPGWYHITLAGCGPISVLIGAALRMLTKPRQAN
jgi:hypothetical protein